MDFFQFIDKNSQKSTPTQAEPVVNDTPKPLHTTYQEVRRGQYVKMIYKENSELNSFKGYIGEIKDYKKGNDHALLILHAQIYPKLTKVPLDHFVMYKH